jgi:malate dehydrogenase
MKKKIALIGAGNVGATLALFVAQKELGDIALVDINGDMAKGKALDIMQAGAVMGFDARITASDDYSIIKDAEVVAVTAGFPRKPGMDRLELLHKNRDIIDDIAANIKKYAPDSKVIVVSNPVDVMTYRMRQQTGFPPYRVMGQAGVLDTGRMLQFLAEKTKINVKDIHGMVLGGHGDTMVPVFSWTRAAGAPVSELVEKSELEKIGERTQKGGGEIVALLKSGSAYYAPAAATAEMVEAIIKDEKRLMPVSCMPEKAEYGIRDIYIGLPVILGSSGVEKIIEFALSADEQSMLADSAGVYQKSVREL